MINFSNKMARCDQPAAIYEGRLDIFFTNGELYSGKAPEEADGFLWDSFQSQKQKKHIWGRHIQTDAFRLFLVMAVFDTTFDDKAN